MSNMIKGDEIIHALAKVKNFIPPEKANEIAFQTNQIHIDLRAWMGNHAIQTYLEMIKSALQERQLVSFAYIAHHGNTCMRTVEPYQLVLKGSHWYLHGFCRKQNDARLFR